MGQILIRNLDDAAIERLKLRASEKNVPLERLIRDTLHEIARPTRDELWAEADRLRDEIGAICADSTAMVREDRDRRR